MFRLSKYEKVLAVLFLLTLPLVRPWVHGDGRGYYAFARALLIQHNLDFEADWYKGYETNPEVATSAFRQNYITSTGHFNNHWTVGPAILWSPFLITARFAALAIDKFSGTQLAADGYSKPYVFAMAFGSWCYGFLALLISARLARKYIDERWVFLASAAIWLATSLTFYLYLEPSFSHVHSAFLVALFVWLWDSTRETRNVWQWLALGAIAGLMMDTYYPNALILLLPLLESLKSYWTALRERLGKQFAKLAVSNLLFAAAALLAFFPTPLTKKIIYGSYFNSGYKQLWYWNSPAFFRVCFSSHGVFSWTPVLIPAVVGLFLLRKIDRALSYLMFATLFAFIYFIGCYQDWHAVPSFGNRFFVSLSVVFVLGLAAFLKELAGLWSHQRVFLPAAAAATALLILWNFGMMFQFGTHLVPESGEISWTKVAFNQLTVVPPQAAHLAKAYFMRRLNAKSTDPQNEAVHPKSSPEILHD
jgi:hypothetical protein